MLAAAKAIMDSAKTFDAADRRAYVRENRGDTLRIAQAAWADLRRLVEAASAASIIAAKKCSRNAELIVQAERANSFAASGYGY